MSRHDRVLTDNLAGVVEVAADRVVRDGTMDGPADLVDFLGREIQRNSLFMGRFRDDRLG